MKAKDKVLEKYLSEFGYLKISHFKYSMEHS